MKYREVKKLLYQQDTRTGHTKTYLHFVHSNTLRIALFMSGCRRFRLAAASALTTEGILVASPAASIQVQALKITPFRLYYLEVGQRYGFFQEGLDELGPDRFRPNG